MKREKNIECESLAIVSPDGKSRIGLAAHDSGPAIHLIADSGRLDVRVLEQGPQIVFSRKGKEQLAVSCTEWSNVIVIYDDRGLPSAKIEKRADSVAPTLQRFKNGQPVKEEDI